MISSRPYLIRALYDWIVDSGLTPHMVVDTTRADVAIPEEHIDGDKIVLNISPSACRGLIIENDRIILTTSFSGLPVQVSFPPAAVFVVYSKEEGRGMFFSNNDAAEGNTVSLLEEGSRSTEVMIPADEFDDLVPDDFEDKSLDLDKDKGVQSNFQKPTSKKNSTKKPSLTVVK